MEATELKESTYSECHRHHTEEVAEARGHPTLQPHGEHGRPRLAQKQHHWITPHIQSASKSEGMKAYKLNNTN
jgi:hypothetical protein